jgi:membrane protease YdiL (CAAX protease family)
MMFGLNRGTLSYETSAALVVGFIALSTCLAALLPEDGVVLTRVAALWVISAGVYEEIIFRGILQGALVKTFRPGPGILLTAALFGASHLDPIQGLYAFTLGIYLGVVTWKSGSIRIAIACHVLHNTLGVLAYG